MYGWIQLIMAIKITHKPQESGEPQVLDSVTWDHWELVGVDDNPEGHQLDDSQPTKYDQMGGFPTTYVAVVQGHKGKHVYSVPIVLSHIWYINDILL